MVKGVNDFSLMGSARLVFLFSFVSIFFMKSVSALVYLGQSYSGWGIGGYGWNDIASLYATSGGWFDFAILFALFYSLALGVFGEKFKDNNAGKGLAVALGLLLSLSLVLYESYMGMSLWELAAPFIVLGALLGTFALVHWTFKAMHFGGLTRVLASTIATWLVWLGITSSIGMGQGTFFGFTMGGFDLREPMAWILIPIFLVLIWNLFKSFGGDPGGEGTGERRRGWPNWLKPWKLFKPLAKNYWKRAGENATKSVERKIARSTKGRPDLMHKQIDPDKLKLLNHYIAKIQDQKNKVFFLNNQLIVDIYTLNENLNKRESSLNLNAWGIGNKLNERVKDISNLKQILVSQNTSLEGLAGLVNYFKIILTELNKVLAITKQINLNPYETYRRKINKSNGEVWSSLNDLKTLINQLFSISREHIGKSVDKLTLAEFMEIIGSWSSSSNEDINDEKMPNPVKETERKEGSSEEELHGPDTKGFAKSIRNEILLRTHPDKTTNPQLRAIFNLTNQAYAEGDYNRLNDLRAQMYKIIGNQQKRLPDSRSSDIEEELRGPDAKLFTKKIYDEITALTSPEQIKRYPVNIQQTVNNIHVYSITAYQENNYQELSRLKEQLRVLLSQGNGIDNEKFVKWTNETISSLTSLHAYMYRMNFAFGQAMNYSRHPKNIKFLNDSGMYDSNTLRDRMLTLSKNLGNKNKEPLTPPRIYKYLIDVANQLADPQLKDDTKKDIFRGILAISQDIGKRLELMKKEEYLLNEVDVAYNLAVPGENALKGKHFEFFVRAAQRYNNFLYGYADKINKSI